MNTTIYIPMPEWQALSFLRNREDAFDRLITPLGVHRDSEVIMENEETLVGFKTRCGAVETGYQTHPQGFAVLRVVMGKLTAGRMSFGGQLTGGSHQVSGAALSCLTRDGVNAIRDKVNQGEVELLMDEIFAPGDAETCMEGCRAGGPRQDDGCGRPTRFGPGNLGGPTGFGGC